MFRKKYLSLFPNTIKAKNVVAPYNAKSLKKKLRATNLKSESSVLKGQPSQTSIQLKNLNDFSSKNPELHMLLLDAGEILKNSTGSDAVSVYMVDKLANEIYLLTGDEHDIYLSRYRFEIKKGHTVAAHVAFNKENVMVENIDVDPRFPEGIGFEFENAESVLCVPVVTPDGECYSVFELIKEDDKEPFNKDDLKVAIVVTGWMGAAIHQNLQRIAMLKQEALHKNLLNVTNLFFNERIDTTQMVTKFMNFAKDTIEVMRGTFFLIDKDRKKLTAEVYEEGFYEEDPMYVRKNSRAKLLHRDRGIASLVARTGKIVNVKDPMRDRRIGNEYELRTGKTIKTLLSMPIISTGGLVGIFHLLNKKYGIFTRADESTLKTFSKYVSCCLQYNTELKRLATAEMINKTYTDHLKRMMKPCSHEYEYSLKTMTVKVPNLLDFKWYIPDAIVTDSPQIAVHMMKDLCDDGNLNHDNLLKFMLTARRLYRAVPYHNFEHAFNFMHCMYNILKRNKSMFSTFEMKALLISSIGHDIDHSGYTNNYLHETDDVLWQLYQESTWENYHFRVTSMLFDQFPIFNTTAKNYKVLMKEIKEAILATDLQRYFKNSKILIPLIRDNNFDAANSEHRYLMKAAMMTVSDLSGQCKPYSIARRLTENVYREFYDEGDKYKMRGLRALPLMDREKQSQIPEEQIQFLSFVVLPATRILESLLPNIDLSKDCIDLQKAWHNAQNERDRRLRKKTHSFI